MDWLKNLFGANKVVEVELRPQPIAVNPGNAGLLARHVGRLSNLYSAQLSGDVRQSVREEIDQRKSAIEAYGHKAPESESEARVLLNRIGA